MRLVVWISLAMCMAGCSTVPSNSQGWIEPVDAIRAANNDPVYGIRGDFVLTVEAREIKGPWAYLNSELDYRDQRNLTVRMPASLVPKLEQRLGVTFADLKNRRVVVQGVARRAKIDFVLDGRPTGKYYFQTHVDIDSATQVKFAD